MSDIKDDELIMAIKLSNDQERIVGLLADDNISDELFVRLLMMYDWHDEEDDDRNDRDVISYTLRRYISIKPHEQDLLYSYLTLRRLATQSQDAKLLLALISLPNFEFILRAKQNTSLRECIAKNPFIDFNAIDKLIHLRSKNIDMALAKNPAVPLSVLEVFAKRNDSELNKALATNTQIDKKLFKALLNKDEEVVSLLLYWQKIDIERLGIIEKLALDSEIFAILGANENLESAVIAKLLTINNISLLVHLSANKTLSSLDLERIYKLENPKTFSSLAENLNTPISLLESLYENYSEDMDILFSLSKNTATPEYILRSLFDKDIFALKQGLATNSSVPLDILDILQVDTRLRIELSENERFVNKVNIILDY